MILLVFGVLAFALAGLFVLIALQTRRNVPFERVQRVGYWIRSRWLAFLVVLLVLVVGGSLFSLPYSSGAGDRVVVRVTGGQFYWSLSRSRFRAGTKVRFDVTSADVNHGFGIYDPKGRLVGSVQAMPGYHNKLDLTLDDPGSYFIGCLELCGLRHHRMNRTFRVTGG